MLTVVTKSIERDSFSLHLHQCKCCLLVKKLDGLQTKHDELELFCRLNTFQKVNMFKIVKVVAWVLDRNCV